MNTRFIAPLLVVTFYSGLLPAEGTYSVGLGADYTSGDYGTGNTATLWSLPFSLAYRSGKWGVGITVPYLVLHSTGNVVVGSGGMIGTGSRTGMIRGGPGGGMLTSGQSTTESGLGDITLRGSIELAGESDYMPWLGLTLKAKLATADENKLLGTGENDYAAQLEMSKGAVAAYAGYKYIGDPAYVDFNNVAYGSVALSYGSSEATRYSVEGYLEQPLINGSDPRRELSLTASRWLDDQRRITGYIMKGFSDASPDWGAGLGLKYSL